MLPPVPGSTILKWFLIVVLAGVILVPDFRDTVFELTDGVLDLAGEFLVDLWGLLF